MEGLFIYEYVIIIIIIIIIIIVITLLFIVVVISAMIYISNAILLLCWPHAVIDNRMNVSWDDAWLHPGKAIIKGTCDGCLHTHQTRARV